jgi:aspartate carbamoyltransferase catalytic subunit
MFKGRDIVSIKELSKEDMEIVFEVAREMIPIARGERKSDLLE